jgi:hypothetical protein
VNACVRAVTAADLTPGVELDGELVRETPGREWLSLPAVVADCCREERDGQVQMRVWWTVGGECVYPLDAALRVLEAAA